VKIETRKYLVLTEHEEQILKKALIAESDLSYNLFRLHQSTEEGQRDHARDTYEALGGPEPTAAKQFSATTWDRTRLRDTINKVQAKAAVIQQCAEDLKAALKETK
jgi:hypothetical protein